MPPRAKKTASPARSRSSSRRTSTSKPSLPVEKGSSPRTPTPDPVAVQRLIDEALARAAARRTATPNGRATERQHTSAVPRRAWSVCAVFQYFFPDAPRVYSPSTTAMLTDLIGTFLVTCLAVYFTVAGYLFYRDVALSA